MIVWQYWTGPRPAALELCMETVRRDYEDVRLIDDEQVQAMGAGEILTIRGLQPAQHADLIRIWLLAHHGGVWLDCDILSVLPIPFEALAAETPDAWLIGFRNGRPVFPNPLLIGRACDALRELYRRQYELATRLAGKPIGYTQLGPRFLAQHAKGNRGMVLRRRRPWLHPWRGYEARKFTKPASGRSALCYAAHVGKDTIRKFGSQSRKEILRSKIAFTALLNTVR